jgi:hypothetical protein
MVGIVSLSCKRDATQIARDDDGGSRPAQRKLIERFPPRNGFRYLEKSQLEGNEGTAAKIERWKKHSSSTTDRLVYDVETTGDPADSTEPTELTRVFFSTDGFGNLGGITLGKYQEFEPPQLILPEGARVGMRWSGKHRYGDYLSTRECEIVVHACESSTGLTSSCLTRTEQQGGKEIELRMHFCEGVGWVGYEVKVRLETGKVLRLWTEVR